jgi:hypothetical protein
MVRPGRAHRGSSNRSSVKTGANLIEMALLPSLEVQHRHYLQSSHYALDDMLTVSYAPAVVQPLLRFRRHELEAQTRQRSPAS